MRKNIVIVGIVLLIIGVGLFFGGAQILAPHVKISTTQSTEVSLGNNLWRTNAITVNGTNYLIEDKSSSSSVYLVSASSLSSLNQSNLKTLGIAPSTHTSVSSKILYTFTVSSPGNYYIVSNSTSQPSNSVSVLNPDSIVGDAIILLAGGALGFIGFIILIIGLVLKKKLPPNPEQY
ncbi:hypothetical protein ACNF42_01545 [Cuniculiplasma sp. SKW3]|uniref:hypothetical protein n=1 Tax=Cuniculiplasma sp. SKW3 TaxID=3400170 RepID=UPI003FD25523